MIVTIVHIFVKPEHVDAFIEATKKNHLQSIVEPGNLRFDVLRDAEEPGKFVLYEAYDSHEAVAAHKQTSHYMEWRDTVEPWMQKARIGQKHHLLFPQKASV